jgi:hypothetical protein
MYRSSIFTIPCALRTSNAQGSANSASFCQRTKSAGIVQISVAYKRVPDDRVDPFHHRDSDVVLEVRHPERTYPTRESPPDTSEHDPMRREIARAERSLTSEEREFSPAKAAASSADEDREQHGAPKNVRLIFCVKGSPLFPPVHALSA